MLPGNGSVFPYAFVGLFVGMGNSFAALRCVPPFSRVMRSSSPVADPLAPFQVSNCIYVAVCHAAGAKFGGVALQPDS